MTQKTWEKLVKRYIRIAEELGYPPETIEKIQKANTEAGIWRALKEARLSGS